MIRTWISGDQCAAPLVSCSFSDGSSHGLASHEESYGGDYMGVEKHFADEALFFIAASAFKESSGTVMAT